MKRNAKEDPPINETREAPAPREDVVENCGGESARSSFPRCVDCGRECPRIHGEEDRTRCLICERDYYYYDGHRRLVDGHDSQPVETTPVTEADKA